MEKKSEAGLYCQEPWEERFRKFWWDNTPEATKEGEYNACKKFIFQELQAAKRSVLEERKEAIVHLVKFYEKRIKQARYEVLVEILGELPKEKGFETPRPIKVKDMKSTTLASTYNRRVGYNLSLQEVRQIIQKKLDDPC